MSKIATVRGEITTKRGHTCKRFIARTERPLLTGLLTCSLNVCQSLSGLMRRNLIREKSSSTLFCLTNGEYYYYHSFRATSVLTEVCLSDTTDTYPLRRSMLERISCFDF